MNWLPIETAPLDADLWLFTPNDEPQMVVGFWSDSWGGWDWRDSLIAESTSEEMNPTHWMPLPAPPEPQA